MGMSMDKQNKIDMSRYKPYGKITSSCDTREIKEKRIVWPDVTKKDLGDGVVSRVIEKKDAENVAEFWKESYPEIYGSQHEWMLRPEEYESRVALKDNWEEDSKNKIYFMLIGESEQTGKILFATMVTKYDYNLQIEMTFFAIHPDVRKGKGGFDVWKEMTDFYKWMQATGAEYATVFLETWHNITQYIWFKRMGFKIAGIFPGNYTRWCGDQNEYRGCTVHMYSFLNDGEKYSNKSDDWQLLPEVKELWDVMEKINAKSEKDI
jgi:N-acetylglutamate synthase-like GNAT family acetyltransferase